MHRIDRHLARLAGRHGDASGGRRLRGHGLRRVGGPPLEIGPWRTVDFDAHWRAARDRAGGAWPNADWNPRRRRSTHLRRADRLLGRRAFERYQFQLWTVDDGHGVRSTAPARPDLPRGDLPTAIGDLAGAMGTCACSASSAEYPNAWNVKRLAAEFARLTTSARTRPSCCGSSRGFTSHYDDLMLLRRPHRRTALPQAAGRHGQRRAGSRARGG